MSEAPWKFIAAAALILASLAILTSVLLFVRVVNEGKSRRSATCRVFEGQYRQEVDQLKKTYKFLHDKPRPYKKGSVEEFAINDMPRLELEAQNDSDLLGAQVPAYCDEPGIGLPEPDPEVPERPPELK